MAIARVPEGLLHAAPADVDLSAKLHYFVKGTATGYDLAGVGGVVAGVIIEGAVAGSPVTVQFGGIGKVIAATAIAANVRISSDSAGKAVVASVNDFEVGTSLPGASVAAGSLVSFMFASGRRHA